MVVSFDYFSIIAERSRHPAPSGRFYFRTTDVTGTIERISSVNGDDLGEAEQLSRAVLPGDNIGIKVELITPVAMEQGLTFAIREGGRTIGSGRVAGIPD